MQCVQCGAQLLPGQIFCSKCGQPVGGAMASPSTVPPAPPVQSSTYPTSTPGPDSGFARPSRVTQHLNVLGILWIVYSMLRLIPGLVLMGIGSMRFPFLLAPVPGFLHGLLGPFLSALGLGISALAFAGVIAGWGLMAHSSWARMLAIVLGCISLIHMPLGTALGIYTLWVLLPQDACREYQRLAGA